MKKKKTMLIAGVVAVAALLGAGGWYLWGNSDTGSSDSAVYVTTVSSLLNTDMGSQNKYAGVVEPQKTVEVKLDSGRTIKEVKVTEGQEVKAGDVLFEYDTSTSADELAQAQLELEQLQNTAKSLQDQITTLQAEKEKAASDEQLNYTIQIQQAQLDLKKNEYDQKSKQSSIEKLQKSSDNSVVTSEIDGIIKSIADVSTSDSSDSSTSPDGTPGSTTTTSSTTSFITILGTGTYRVKGTVNEQNMNALVEGAAVIIRSRLDDTQTWKGTLSSIDTENPSSSTTDSSTPGTSTTESDTTSSSYPFYVSLESTDGLMLGQHVLVEMDYGQEEIKEGIWLPESYLVDADSNPYVWASTSKDRLEKRSVTLGEYDQEQGRYEITDGLTENDCIAFPAENLKEGMKTSTNASAQIVPDSEEESSSPDTTTPEDTQEEMTAPEGAVIDSSEDAEGNTTPEGADTQVQSTAPEGADEKVQATSPLEDVEDSGPSSPAEDPELNGTSDSGSEVGPQ